MAEGGSVKGVHKSIDLPDEDILPGTSRAGVSTKAAKLTTSHPDPAVNKFWNKSAKLEHGRVLGEIRDMKDKDRSGMGYADGGRVKGVQDPYNKWHITEPGSTGESGGVSIAGHSLRTGGEWGKEGAKEDHRRGIREIKEMGKRDRTNLAEGGYVYSGKQRSDNEQGVHPHDIGPHARTKTSSYAGNQVGWANRDNDPKQIENAKKEHGRVLGEMRSMKKPSLYADGGEVEDYDEEGEHELRHAMGGELMDALDRKDKKGIMDALEACVLSIKGRHE